MQIATFGAGCFWGVEDAFRKADGVISTSVGYCGGDFENPTYEDVCSGETGHAEAVRVEFDETKVSYDDLLNIFWNIHNPTTLNRQGPDIGTQYRSIIFFHNSGQEKLALESLRQEETVNKYNLPIVTEIVAESVFYRAEEYHQQYFEKRGISHCRT